MSFRCEGPDCQVIKIGPGIKPTLVAVLTRAATYSVMKRVEAQGDARGEGLSPALTYGIETVKEIALCPSCAGIDPPTPASEEAQAALLKTALYVKGPRSHGGKDHRSECKKYLDDCFVCKNYIEASRQLPLERLAVAIEDPLKGAMKVSLASIAFSNLRTTDNTKRAALDVKAAFAHIAPWAKRNNVNKL